MVGRPRVEHLQVAGEIVPGGHAFAIEHRREGMRSARAGMAHRGEAGLAGELGGDALHHLAGDAAVAQHPVLGLAEHVDEAGRDDQSGGVDARRAAAAPAARRPRRCDRRRRRHRRRSPAAPVPSTTRPPVNSRSQVAAGCAATDSVAAAIAARRMQAGRRIAAHRRDIGPESQAAKVQR